MKTAIPTKTETKKTSYIISPVIQGVFWKIFSIGCFSVINAIVKFLSGGSPIPISTPMPIYAIIFFQNFFGLMVLIPVAIYTKKTTELFTPKVPLIHLSRLTVGIAGLFLWYYSLRHMQIIQVIALSFVSPIIYLLCARYFLKEGLTWQKLTAIGLSLIGGFFIIRPDRGIQTGDSLGLIALVPIISTIFFAGDRVCARKIMSVGESAFTLTFYLLATSTFLCAIPCFYYGFPAVSLEYLPLLLLFGVLCALAHFGFSKAYQFAEVSYLLPFGLSKFMLCGLAGYFAFNELPATLSMWIGLITVMLSSIILNIRAKKKVKPTCVDANLDLNSQPAQGCRP